ncbi:MAG: HAMP domain-containing histidine kinase [Planctomycetes bacterium]|nr:HAMP domain-containing histidine kinase [Planctomycetota bacterium]
MAKDPRARFLANTDLFDDLAHPLCLVDPDGALRYSNRAFDRFARPAHGQKVFAVEAAVPTEGKRVKFLFDPELGRIETRDIPIEEWREGVGWTCHVVEFLGADDRLDGRAYHFYVQGGAAAVLLEETLRQLDTVNKIKSDFLTLVSHELNTPLTALLGFAELLMEPADLPSASIHEFCREIWLGSRRIHAIVTDILNLCRLDAGLLEYHKEILDFGDLVSGTVVEFEEEFELKKVRIELDLAPGLPALKFDREKIRDALSRVLANALAASEPGRAVEVRTADREREVVCLVHDQGRGLGPEELDKLFEEFAPVGDIQHHTSGLGLGLTLARRMVEEGHGGKMWATSKGPEQGTTVCFSLPKFLVQG